MLNLEVCNNFSKTGVLIFNVVQKDIYEFLVIQLLDLVL